MDHIPSKLISHAGSKWELTDFDADSEISLEYTLVGEKAGMVISPANVEIEFTRGGRPEPQSNIIVQGKWECAAASLAMLLDVKLFHAKRAMGQIGWRNDDKGASDKQIIAAGRLLGRDLISIKRTDIKPGIGPCSVTVKSLNVKNMCHAITWNGKEMLDPNWGRESRKFYGCEWAPWTLQTRGALVLLNKNLTDAERAEYDEAVRTKDAKELKAIRADILKALQESS